MKEDVPVWEVWATGSGLDGWRTCFERWLEPREVGRPGIGGLIAGIEESFYRLTAE